MPITMDTKPPMNTPHCPSATLSSQPFFSSYSAYDFIRGHFNYLLNSLISWKNANGGLLTFWHTHLTKTHFFKKTFSISESRSFKGVTAHLFEFNHPSEKKHLLQLNTHLDPIHFENKLKQSHEIQSFLLDICQQLEKSSFDFQKCVFYFFFDSNLMIV